MFSSAAQMMLRLASAPRAFYADSRLAAALPPPAAAIALQTVRQLRRSAFAMLAFARF